MKRLYILCEGQTEEVFTKKILASHLSSYEIVVQPILFKTNSHTLKKQKGGVNDYNKVIKEITNICNEHPNEYVTSFFDYYGLKNIPTICNYDDKYKMIYELENHLKNSVNRDCFIPYISLHEFEALLFSKPDEFVFLDKRAATKFIKILEDFDGNPELINNSFETAPSKRIIKEISSYSKVSHGNMIAKRITLETIRKKCSHFSSWISELERL